MRKPKPNKKQVKFPPSGVQKSQLLKHANENRRLRTAAIRVLTLLLDHHNPNVGRVFPSQASIASRLGYSVRWIRTAIKQLAEERYVFAARGKGPGRSTSYTFPLVNLSNSGEASALANRTDRESRHPASDFRSDRKFYAHWTGTRVPPNLPMNSSMNLSAEKGSKLGAPSSPRYANPQRVRAKNKSRERIEGELVDALGGPIEGYTILCELDEPLLANLIAQIAFGNMTLSEAILVIRNEVDGC